MKARKIYGVLPVLLAAGVLLSGCLDEKRNRITKYEPGVYKGPKDRGLTVAQRRELQLRVREQSGSTTPAGGGGGSATRARSSGSVRMPEDSMALYGRLNSRANNQRGP